MRIRVPAASRHILATQRSMRQEEAQEELWPGKSTGQEAREVIFHNMTCDIVVNEYMWNRFHYFM